MNQRKPAWKLREDGLGWDFTPKVVGEERPPDPALALRWNREMLRLSPNLGRWFARGVYKFKTWEDLQQWTRKHQAEKQ